MPTRRAVSVFAALLLAACAHTAPVAPRQQVRRFTVLAAGSAAGSEVVTVAGNDRVIDYEFNDRGRGPKTRTVVTLDARGLPLREQTTGNDYYKTAVDERLAPVNGKAHYSNRSELGDGSPDAFYVGMFAPPEEVGLLARALRKAGGHLPLLPAGEASLTTGETLDLGNGTRVTRYEISGLNFTPQSVWLDQDGEFFATVSSWSSVIRQGWETSAQRLIDAGDDAEKRQADEIARSVTRRPRAIAVSHARLFDPHTLRVTPDTTILVRGNRIEAVGPKVDVPADAEIVDAAGRTVIPGLWDMHVHLGGIDGLLDIASGVTTVRDLANDTDYLLALRQRFADGSNVGPRVILAGILEGPGPYHGPTKVLVDDEQQVRAAIDKYVSLGYVQVKIYSSIRPELVPFIATYAHSKGLRVSGHVPAFMNAEEAVRDGYDEIQHANFVLLNFMRDVRDTRTPLRFTAIGDRAAAIDLHSPEVRSFFDLLREKRTVIDPTASVFEGLLADRPGVLSASVASIAGRLPPQVRRGFLAGGLAVDASNDALYRAGFEKVLELVRALHDGGIPIVAGTDGLAGFTLHRELELYVRAGIPAPEVLRIATLGAAEVMHRDSELGSVEPGKLADLVVIDGDPTIDISDVRKPLWVVKDGMLFDAKAVYAAVGVR